MRIYIASAYTKGDVGINVKKVIDAADLLVSMGHLPYLPHLTHFWHLISPKDYQFWLDYDMDFVENWAEGILRLDNESSGADKEVLRATELNIPVYYKIRDLPNPS